MPFPFFGRGTLYSQGLSNVSMVIKFFTHICEHFIIDFSQPLDSLYASGGSPDGTSPAAGCFEGTLRILKSTP